MIRYYALLISYPVKSQSSGKGLIKYRKLEVLAWGIITGKQYALFQIKIFYFMVSDYFRAMNAKT
jgi:hypothetical protein